MVTWQAQPEDLARVFREQNPWHTDSEVPSILAHEAERSLAAKVASLLIHDRPLRFHVILGPRRVGKTTVMYQALRRLLLAGYASDRLWWMRLDHPLLMSANLGDLVRAALDGRATDQEPLILFLDELVYAKDWDLWLKTFYDDRWPVRIVATSSATAALRDRRLESGVGRWEEHYLTPYLFGEFLDLVGAGVPVRTERTLAATLATLPERLPERTAISRLRHEFLLKGGFPELLMNRDGADDQTELIRSQQILRGDAVERAIYKDIPQSFGVESPLTLERLLYALGGQMAGLLSPSQVGGALGLTQPRFDRYLSYLERAFLVFLLPNYSGSELNVQKRGRKLFFVDGAVRNAALQRGDVPLDHPEEMGLLQENLVASNLHALSLQDGVRIHHWRDSKYEVDLIYDHPTEPLGFEVGSSADHSRAGLRALMAKHPRFKGRCYVIAPQATTVPPSRHSSGVGTLPLDLFLAAVARQADLSSGHRDANSFQRTAGNRTTIPDEYSPERIIREGRDTGFHVDRGDAPAVG